MSVVKLKVFLGGYVNYPNAQNFNCLSLAKHLDKSKFDVRVLSIYSRPSPNLDGVTIYQCKRPHSLTAFWAYFLNILTADVIYLPKGELLGFNTFVCRLFDKKCFTTFEGVLDVTNTSKAIQKSGANVFKYYRRFTRCYSISPYIKTFNEENHRLFSEPTILELGTDTTLFSPKISFTPLKHLVMIASSFNKKGIHDYLSLAQNFPSLTFHLIGQKDTSLSQSIADLSLTNVVEHGFLDRSSYQDVLSDIQLHILPSRSEGFPKVILETACLGIPSLVYSDYGASQWITHHENGFVTSTFDELKAIVNQLILEPQLLEDTSKAAIQLGQSYDWKYKIKSWEEVLLSFDND